MSAARPSRRRGVEGGADAGPRRRTRSTWRAAGRGAATVIALEPVGDRREVLVAAARQTEQHDRVVGERRRGRSCPRARRRARRWRAPARAPAGCPRSASSSRTPVDGLVVGRAEDLEPAGLEERRQLRPDARVVQPGRDRVGLRHLAVVVLEQVRARSVEHARRAARERRGVLACESLPCRLDADEPRRGLADEARHEADRVRAAADARDRDVRAAGPRPSRTCCAASSPMTRWRSRTSAGNGCGPTAEPST